MGTATVNPLSLNIQQLFWLAAGVLLSGMPHWQQLPVWIPLLFLLLLVSRLYITARVNFILVSHYRLVNVVKYLLVAASVVGVYLSYNGLTGRNPSIALLTLLTSLKFFESRQARDYYITTYLCYFLSITNFFYTQNPIIAAYMLVVIVILTTGLIYFHDPNRQYAIAACAKLAGVLLVQALPIMLVLFILFPRIDGPLWGLPEDTETGITGIDDEISLGTISKLVTSDEVAFRVKFTEQVPAQSQLYWRGPVLWYTDGQKWTVGLAGRMRRPRQIDFSGEPLAYELIIEPTNKNWLFGLEMINAAPANSYLTHDHQLKAIKPIRSRQVYQLQAQSEYYLDETGTNLTRALQLPRSSHEKAKALGQSLAQQYQDQETIIAAALAWFENENFTYTLEPPLINGDPIDGFLFGTRQGFCEHYATAFTVLMRAAGIPARVITGYLGGEFNAIGNFLIVRQYHAHAWAEVWVAGKGWMRIDPTNTISTRVIDGIENALPQVVDVPLNLQNNILVAKLWQQFHNTATMINYQWAQWVLGYSAQQQQQLLKKIGFERIDWLTITIILFIAFTIVITAIAIYIFTRTVNSGDPAKRYYDSFCKKIAQLGFAKRSNEGPREFAQRVSAARQDLADDINNITRLYILVRYGSKPALLVNLQQAIKLFSPKKTTR